MEMFLATTRLPPVLLQASEDGADAALAEAIVVFILLAMFVATAGVVAAWMYRDAQRRGQGGLLWAGVWAAPAVFVAFLMFVGFVSGSPVGMALASILVLILGGLVIMIAWVASRSPTILYDRKGNPVHPRAVLRRDPALVPGHPPPAWAVPTQAQAYAPPPQYAAYVPPTPPAPAPVPAGQHARVRCPNCQTVFEYTKNPWGPSRVACPNCRLSGTI